ncbi:MAG: hypothetical protein Q8P32_04075 [Candidatus Komeilibacteria bacterium]|nr:hypothetical protein [Candidatus Komeilibacteria bacterium]
MNYHLGAPGATDQLKLDSEPFAFGGEGNLHDISVFGLPQIAKIFHQALSLNSAKHGFLKNLVELSRADNLLNRAALPWQLIFDQNDQLAGYTMQSCLGWSNLGDLLQDDEAEFGFKEVAWVFCRLHQALTAAHSAGLVIGDFNAGNIMFRLNGQNCEVCLVDTDSWNKPADNYYSLMIKPGQAQHPELYQAIVNNQALPPVKTGHDWWSFAYLLFCSLTKCDPFSGAKTDNKGELLEETERILGKLTVRYPDIQQDPDNARRILAIGKPQMISLDRLLTAKSGGQYPLWLLAELYRYAAPCHNCGNEVNYKPGVCPYCAAALWT